MEGKGIHLTCHACSKQYTLGEYGQFTCEEGECEFTYPSDWNRWQRACVREELERGTYQMRAEVDICMAIDERHLYRVGEGSLLHDTEGLHLTGCDGELNYTHAPLASYTLDSDFNWYEIGDMIGIGDNRALYYCFPKENRHIVAKARLATEELYRIASTARREKKNKNAN